MRCLYRETKYICGDYAEIDIYPVFTPPRSCRRRKARPTSAVQQRLNQKNAERKMIRLANTNFTEDDIRFDLTYDDDNLPENPAAAMRQLQNFLRRLKRYRQRQQLPALKYIAVTQCGKTNGRIHHHVIMNGGIDVNVLAKMWGRGYTTVKPLCFGRHGIERLAQYLLKSSAATKRWSASRNLKHPTVRQRDGRLSGRKIQQLARDEDAMRRQYDNFISNYIYADSSAFYNDVNGGHYLTVYLYRSRTPHSRR